MKYSKFTYPLFAMALASGVASCSSASEEEPDFKVDPEGMHLEIVVSMPGESFSRASSDAAGTLAERIIDTNRLYIASYNEKGELISQIFPAPELKANEKEPSVSCDLYPNQTWGPTIAVHFNKEEKEKHMKGFRLVAYMMPKEHYANEDFPYNFNPTDPTRFVLKMPGYDAKTLWAPSEKVEDGHQIPMVGMVKVTEEVLNKYDAFVHRFSPFRLPEIPMMRAMAKIEVNDPDDFIESAEFQLTKEGYVLPAKSMWWDNGKKAVAAPKYDSRNWIKGEKKDHKFVFYCYETAFPTQDATHTAREIIKMKAKADAGLSKTESSIYFSPYDTDGNREEKSETELMTYQDGIWSGILRNHVYSYTVLKPQIGDLEIFVTTKEWEEEREAFEF